MSVPGVILAVAAGREAAIAEALAGRRDLEVVRRCADLAEAVAAARAGVGSLVVVSDHPRLTRDVVADLRSHAVAVVGLPSTPEAGEQLRRLGILAVAAHDADAAAVADAVALALHDDSPVAAAAPEEVPLAAGGRMIAVWGPTGAPGRSTLALTLGAELASRGLQTLVVDADTHGGAIAQACGLLDESPGIAALARIAQHGSVTAADIAVHAQRLGDHLAVVTGISRPTRWVELPGAALDEVWNAARDAAHATVVDCGFGLERDEELTYDTRAPQRHAATLSALEAADVVVAVGSAEPLGIQRLIHGLADLREAGIAQPVVVVNRVRADVAGSRPDEAVADALTRYAGVERVWTLPWDPRAADAATLAGRTLVERAPRSRLRRAIAGLAHFLSDDPTWPASARTVPAPPAALSH
ncbi:MAG: CpaE family protein [Demequina sp.]|uniref:AAA family ATPase n=1 Tax=Demequina sp. TaxID=2050685 RepID=UPI003A8B7EC1